MTAETTSDSEVECRVMGALLWTAGSTGPFTGDAD